MASNIVEYILDLKTKKAQAGLEGVSKKSKQLTSGLKVMAGAVLGVGAAFASASVIFLKFAQAQSDVINDLNDLSTRSGVSARSILGLQLAFKASGQEISQVKPLLDKLPKVLANIDRGTGTSTVAFNRLGLELRHSSGEMKEADQVFNEMITAVQAIENPTLKATTAAELFGRAAGNLLQSFGAQESLKTFTDITERWGVDIGPAATDQAAKFQQSMGVLMVVTQKFGQVFAKVFGTKGFVAPIQFAMEVVVQLTSLIDSSLGFIKMLIPRMSAEFDLAIAETKKKLLDMKDWLTTNVAALLGISIDVTENEKARVETFKQIKNIRREIEGLPDLGKSFDNIFEQPTKDLINFRTDFNKFLKDLEGASKTGINIPEIKAPEIEGLDSLIADLDADIVKSMKEANRASFDEFVQGIEFAMEDWEKSMEEVEAQQKEIDRIAAERIQGIADFLGSLSSPGAAINQIATMAFDKYLGKIAPIATAAFGLFASLGEGVISALSSQIERSIDLSTSSMDDIIKAQESAVKTLQAIQRPDSKEAAAAERVAKVEQKIQAETLKKELAALKGAPGEEMALAREIALMESEIQAVAFAKAIGQGIQMLPGMLLQVLPSLLFEMVKGIIEAIFTLPFRIWEALKEGFRSIVDAISLGLGDKFEAAGEGFRSTAQAIGEWIKNIGSGQAGLRFTGSQSGLALLHPKEVVVPESGRMSQAVGRSMAQQSGGGGINISINSLVTERSAIDELVRQVERRFYTFGNSTSPLFN